MKRHKKQAGFTLVELMIYTTLTAVIVGLFGSILVTITRIQGQQSGSVTVAREINFLMSAVTSRIRDSINIVDITGSRLELSTNSYPADTTIIDLTGGKIVIEENGQAIEDLSNDKIVVDSLVFTQRSDVTNPSSVVISISITASNNTTVPQNMVSRTVETSASPLLLSQ